MVGWGRNDNERATPPAGLVTLQVDAGDRHVSAAARWRHRRSGRRLRAEDGEVRVRARRECHPCDDGSPCTVGDVCLGGACTPSQPKICEPIDQCHLAGSCDKATDACSTPNAPDETTCEDGDLCTVGDQCVRERCAPGVCKP